MEGTAATFISRRESQFRDYPPTAAQRAVVIAFFGELPIWVRAPTGGWHFPSGTRRSGETIGDVAKRQLWETTRLVAGRIDLLGCLTRPNGKAKVSYVYMCEVDRLPGWAERPEGMAEVGVFLREPRPVEGDWCTTLLAAAERARRTGLR